jgi:hypothetical protein
MAQSYKILGQIFPTTNTVTNVYVTPAATSAIVSTIYITNQDSANANVDIIVRPINEALANKHYVLRSQNIDAADTLILNLNITMNAAVILAGNVSIKAGETKAANVTFNAFGVEVT